jgi:hypothetical protein
VLPGYHIDWFQVLSPFWSWLEPVTAPQKHNVRALRPWAIGRACAISSLATDIDLHIEIGSRAL